MALDVLITTDRISGDPVGRDFIDYCQRESARLGFDKGALYYDFPTYADYETIAHKPDALIISRIHGILAVRFVADADASMAANSMVFEVIDESLAQFCSILIGRLLKSRHLRKGLSSLRFHVTPVLFMPGQS